MQYRETASLGYIQAASAGHPSPLLKLVLIIISLFLPSSIRASASLASMLHGLYHFFSLSSSRAAITFRAASHRPRYLWPRRRPFWLTGERSSSTIGPRTEAIWAMPGRLLGAKHWQPPLWARGSWLIPTARDLGRSTYPARPHSRLSLNWPESLGPHSNFERNNAYEHPKPRSTYSDRRRSRASRKGYKKGLLLPSGRRHRIQ
jgi:hypothetical protein